MNIKHALYCGDSSDLIYEIEKDSVKLIITSPPYNIGKNYEKKINLFDYLEEQKRLISEFQRILKDDGSICWQVGNFVDKGEVYPLDIFYYQIFKEYGFYLRNRIIWHFGHGLHASKRFSGRYETILWFTKSKEYTFNLDSVRVPSKYPNKKHFKGDKKGELSGNPLGKNPADVWEIVLKDWEKEIWEIPNVKHNHPEKTNHPCQYPIELAERCILALTNKGDTVFDPYMGVGSSILAAIKNGRYGIGIDKEKDYIETAENRIKDYYNGTLGYRELGKPIYEPTKRKEK